MSVNPRMDAREAPIEIIRAGVEHVDAVAPLFDAYRRFYKQPRDLAGARAFLVSALRDSGSVVFLAYAKAGDAAAAVGFTQLYPTLSSVAMGRRWILNDLFVSESQRGAGVGRALMLHAAAFAKGTGAARMTLTTAIDNSTAKRLYESLGWVRDDKYDHYSLAL